LKNNLHYIFFTKFRPALEPPPIIQYGWEAFPSWGQAAGAWCWTLTSI